MGLGRDSEKAKNKTEGNMERGAEHVKKAFDSKEKNLEHDAKIEASKAKEDVKNEATDIKHDMKEMKKEEEEKRERRGI